MFPQYILFSRFSSFDKLYEKKHLIVKEIYITALLISYRNLAKLFFLVLQVDAIVLDGVPKFFWHSTSKNHGFLFLV